MLVLLVYGGLLVLTYWGFDHTPDRLHPVAGHGLPAGQRAAARLGVARAARDDVHATRSRRSRSSTPGVKHTIGDRRAVVRCSSANGSNFGSMFVILDDVRRAARPGAVRRRRSSSKLARASSPSEIPEAHGDRASAPPPVRGVGRAGGFKLMIEDRGDLGPDDAAGADREPRRARRNRASPSADRPVHGLPRQRRRSSTSTSTATRVHDQGGRAPATSSTRCRSTSGSLYVNDFNRFGRTWQVIVQAEPQFRNQIEDVNRLKVRNSQGDDGAARRRWPTSARSTARWC